MAPLQIETDSLETIHMLEKGNMLYDNFILKCRSLLQLLRAPRIVHIFSEQNRVADILAKTGATQGRNIVFGFLEVPPVCVQNQLRADTVGTTFARIVTLDSNLIQDMGVTQYITNSYSFDLPNKVAPD